MKAFFTKWMTNGKAGSAPRQILAAVVIAVLVGSGGAMAVLYVNGHWRLERHAQNIASYFPPEWMGTDGDPIPKYSRIRKRAVLHNREAPLFKIVGLDGSTPKDSTETLFEVPAQTEVDFRYWNQRYQFHFEAREPLGFVAHLLFGATQNGLLVAVMAGLGGWAIVWLSFWRAERRPKGTPVPSHDQSTSDFIEERAPESKHLEYKQVLRWNSQKGDYCKTKEHLALKNIASFLNTEGGTLLVGVSDDIRPTTEERDQFETIDDAKRHLENIMRRMSPNPVWMDLIDDVSYDTVDGHDILRIDCLPSEEPVFLTDVRSGKEKEQRFYKRTSAASPELEGREMSAYIRNHFADR